MANITMIHVDERPIKMNSLRELSEEEKSSLHIRMQLILQYREGSAAVGLQVEITYVVSESDILLQYQALYVVNNDEWQSFLASKPEKDAIKSYSGEMFDVVLGYARSSIAKNTVGTELSALYLPVFKKEEYTKTVSVVKVD